MNRKKMKSVIDLHASGVTSLETIAFAMFN